MKEETCKENERNKGKILLDTPAGCKGVSTRVIWKEIHVFVEL